MIQRIFGWSDVIFDHNDRDPRRTQDQADTDDKNLKAGRESINEQRKRLGMAPIEGGDEYFIMTPTGAVPIAALPKIREQMLAEETSQNEPSR